MGPLDTEYTAIARRNFNPTVKPLIQSPRCSNSWHRIAVTMQEVFHTLRHRGLQFPPVVRTVRRDTSKLKSPAWIYRQELAAYFSTLTIAVSILTYSAPLTLP